MCLAARIRILVLRNGPTSTFFIYKNYLKSMLFNLLFVKQIQKITFPAKRIRTFCQNPFRIQIKIVRIRSTACSCSSDQTEH
jgi:hypothetical protein